MELLCIFSTIIWNENQATMKNCVYDRPETNGYKQLHDKVPESKKKITNKIQKQWDIDYKNRSKDTGRRQIGQEMEEEFIVKSSMIM